MHYSVNVGALSTKSRYGRILPFFYGGNVGGPDGGRCDQSLVTRRKDRDRERELSLPKPCVYLSTCIVVTGL